nr:polyglutamine binding protein 1 [Hymenolepis microstoma]
MPLPPALAARLAKRGLLDKDKNEEEVFAENYDNEGSAPVLASPKGISPVPVFENGILIYEVAACPNRSNLYHECSVSCFNRFGRRTFRSNNPNMIRLRDRMLRRYPLPTNWVEVGDPVSGRFYYWNMVTDDVSWLSPTHPRAVITKSASALKVQMLAAKTAAANISAAILGTVGGSECEIEDGESKGRDRSKSPTTTSSRPPLLSSIMAPPSGPPPRLANSIRRPPKFDKRRRGDNDPLDPMDPASYSDVPRGGWTDGLEGVDSAKTGADTTASGPLFQQRPYPSPGEIMRANAKQRQE